MIRKYLAKRGMFESMWKSSYNQSLTVDSIGILEDELEFKTIVCPCDQLSTRTYSEPDSPAY